MRVNGTTALILCVSLSHAVSASAPSSESTGSILSLLRGANFLEDYAQLLSHTGMSYAGEEEPLRQGATQMEHLKVQKAADRSKYTALQKAVATIYRRHMIALGYDQLKPQLDSCINIAPTNGRWKEACMEAFATGDVLREAWESLGADKNTVEWIQMAARASNLDLVKFLWNKLSPEEKTRDLIIACLENACIKDSVAIVRFLRARVNELGLDQSEFVFRAKLHAVQYGSFAVLEYYLCDKMTTEHWPDRYFQFASQYDQLEMMKYLETEKIGTIDIDYALRFAAREGHTSILEHYLFDANNDLELSDNFYEEVFSDALVNLQVDVVHLLLRKKDGQSLVSSDFLTALWEKAKKELSRNADENMIAREKEIMEQLLTSLNVKNPKHSADEIIGELEIVAENDNDTIYGDISSLADKVAGSNDIKPKTNWIGAIDTLAISVALAALAVGLVAWMGTAPFMTDFSTSSSTPLPTPTPRPTQTPMPTLNVPSGSTCPAPPYNASSEINMDPSLIIKLGGPGTVPSVSFDRPQNVTSSSQLFDFLAPIPTPTNQVSPHTSDSGLDANDFTPFNVSEPLPSTGNDIGIQDGTNATLPHGFSTPSLMQANQVELDADNPTPLPSTGNDIGKDGTGAILQHVSPVLSPTDAVALHYTDKTGPGANDFTPFEFSAPQQPDTNYKVLKEWLKANEGQTAMSNFYQALNVNPQFQESVSPVPNLNVPPVTGNVSLPGNWTTN